MSPNQGRSYSASYDSTTKVISAGVCALFAAIAMVAGSAAAIPGAIAAGLGAAIVILCYAYSPRGYVVSGRSIIVNRLIGDACIPLDGMREAKPATEDDFRGCLRLFGSGGMFGYYGLFQTSKLGKCTWYVTNRKRAVVVVTASRTALFSPDDLDGFLAAIRQSAPAPPSAPGAPVFESMQSGGHGALIGKLIGATLGIAAIAAVAFGMLYSPGPPDYTLTPDSLTIRDRFYPATIIPALVDVAHVRIVDFTVDTGWRPVERTNGFANSHYHAGWFRLASGEKVRLYRADGNRLVLLPGKSGGTTVLLEARNPEQFLDALRQAWSSQPNGPQADRDKLSSLGADALADPSLNR